MEELVNPPAPEEEGYGRWEVLLADRHEAFMIAQTRGRDGVSSIDTRNPAQSMVADSLIHPTSTEKSHNVHPTTQQRNHI